MTVVSISMTISMTTSGPPSCRPPGLALPEVMLGLLEKVSVWAKVLLVRGSIRALSLDRVTTRAPRGVEVLVGADELSVAAGVIGGVGGPMLVVLLALMAPSVILLVKNVGMDGPNAVVLVGMLASGVRLVTPFISVVVAVLARLFLTGLVRKWHRYVLSGNPVVNRSNLLVVVVLLAGWVLIRCVARRVTNVVMDGLTFR